MNGSQKENAVAANTGQQAFQGKRDGQLDLGVVSKPASKHRTEHNRAQQQAFKGGGCATTLRAQRGNARSRPSTLTADQAPKAHRQHSTSRFPR